MRSVLRRLIPASWISVYHAVLARLAAWWYGYPSEELIVVGVTGTKGKTTVCALLASALGAVGDKVGVSTTAFTRIHDQSWSNTTGMTMPGRFALQALLRRMVKAGCRYAIIETSSQGLIQHRHIGINYDIAVFTNLSPEHLDAHGGFEAYKAVKRLLFEHLARCPEKYLDHQDMPKAVVLNADDPYADYYAKTPGLPQIHWFGLQSARGLTAHGVSLEAYGSTFVVNDVEFRLALPGSVNIENALAALTVASVLKIPFQAVRQAFGSIISVPGRFERVDVGQPWTVVVDYAHHPESLERLYEAMASVPHHRIIHVFGAAGGGRDTGKRMAMGSIVGSRADTVIVTNEDPFDEDPRTIMEQVANGARKTGKKDEEDLLIIEDRHQAIQRAMQMAGPGDLVLLTGKGAESSMRLAHGQTIPWNEIKTTKEVICSILQTSCR